jgi:hypothetical protein
MVIIPQNLGAAVCIDRKNVEAAVAPSDAWGYIQKGIMKQNY